MTRLSREQVCERLGVKPESLRQYLNRSKRAEAMGRDITSRPYRSLPLPDDDGLWDEQVIDDYLADAAARTDGRRRRTRGPANRVIVVDGEPRMVVLVEHQVTREQLRNALAAVRAASGEDLPTSRAALLPLVRLSLEQWGTRNVDARFRLAPGIDTALNILWPEEA